MNDGNLSNQKWIFLRGLGREIGHWGMFPEVFTEVTGIKPVLIDLPCVGNSKVDKIPFSMLKIVQSLKKEVSPPYSILGISLGGMVALEWAKKYPNEIKKLVVINSSASNLNFPTERITPYALRAIAKIAKEKNLQLRESLILDMVTNHLDSRSEWVEKFALIAKIRAVPIKVVISQLICASIFRVSQVKCRVLILGSKNDKLCNSHCSEKLSKYLNAPIEWHPTAGHDVTLEDPFWTAEKVKNWLGSEI